MLWFSFAIIGYFLLAIVFILDKLIVSRSVNKPVIYAFYSTIFMLGVLVIQPFVGFPFKNFDWLWGLISGMSFGLGLWTLYIAVKEGEATHIDPFNGGMITLITYLLSSTFLNEQLTGLQIGGMLILSFACLLLSFEKSKLHSGFHKGFIWAIISGLFFAISTVSIKYLYLNYDFLPSLVWSRGTAGLVGILLLLAPTVRKSFVKPKENKQKIKKKNNLFLIIANKSLGIVAIVLLQYATAIGSVTLVNALGGSQYVLMFVMIYISTKFYPKFFKEYFTKRELAIEIIAIVLVALGSIFFIL